MNKPIFIQLTDRRGRNSGWVNLQQVAAIVAMREDEAEDESPALEIFLIGDGTPIIFNCEDDLQLEEMLKQLRNQLIQLAKGEQV